MIGLAYQLQGVEAALQRLQALTAMQGLGDELEAAGDDMLPLVKAYPPERPSQRYVRQYMLRNSWRRGDAKRTGHAVEVDVSNPTEYGPPVMGDEQAEAFKDRWRPLRKIGETQRGAVRARVQAWALRTWRGG